MARKKTLILVGIVILAAAGVAVYYFYLAPRQPEGTPVPLPQDQAVAEHVQPKEEIEPIEVELNESDDLVREMVKRLSSNPELARWLASDNLIRTFVSTVDVIAHGGSPRRLIDFIEIGGDFEVSQTEGKVFINPRSYRRYNRIAEIFASLNTQGCVKLYKQLRLPIEQAYEELGYPEEDFSDTLKKAIQTLLETPIVEDRIYLEKDVVTYAFADPELEKLNPAQKHLLRMGPDNIRAIQTKLQEISQAMGF